MASAARSPSKAKTRRTNKPANKASSRQRVKQLSWFDRLLRTLPFSESEIQTAFTWASIAGGIGILFAIAIWLGIPAMLYQQYAELSAKAGFEVKRVEITGMDRVDQLKVYDIVLAEKDRAMPLVDIGKIRSDLIKYGWIKEVRVSRRLPDTLVVAITERKPTAIWQRGNKRSLIDEKGIVLQNVSPSEGSGLPTLNGEGANTQAVALAELIEQAPSLKPQISGASWVGNRRWDLLFKTGETLALPEGEQEAAAALLNFARMDGIHRLIGKDNIRFDLRDPSRMYVRKAPKQPVKPSEPADSKSANVKNKETV
jgi:cell division protein FtsQ